MTAARRRQAGFTLLEVMIALAILGSALVILLRMSSSDVRASHRAKLVTIATGLARAKMYDLEDQLVRDGFPDTTETRDGDFSDEEQPRFRWEALIEKVELPTPEQVQEDSAKSPTETIASGAGNEQQLLELAGGAGGAMGAGLVQASFPLIKPVLEQAIRKVTLTVSWNIGKDEESFDVVQFLIDSKAVAAAARLPGGLAPGGGTPPGGDGDPPGGDGDPPGGDGREGPR